MNPNAKIKIINTFNKAPIDALEHGMSWYEKAHNECLLLSQVFELPLSKVVGVVAALSPNNKWFQNLKDAWKFLDKPHMNTKVCTFKSQRRKALNILKCSGDSSEILSILNGPKTKNFYSNILDYKTSKAVTVDLWIYRFVELNNSKKNFEATEQVFLEAANELNVMPHQLQAVIWGSIRGGLSA